MARMSGADADELERLGNRMQEAAHRLEGIRGEIGGTFGRAHWEGDDAQHFHDLWTHRLSGLLLQAATATRHAGTVAVHNAQQQRAASGSDNGPIPFTGSLGPRGGGGGGDPGEVKEWDIFGSFAGIAGGGGAIVRGIMESAGKYKVLEKAGELAEKYKVLGKLGDLADSPWLSKGAQYAGKFEKFGGKLGDFGKAWEVANLGLAIYHHDSDAIKVGGVNVAADAIFTGLEFASVGFPPAFIAVGAAEIGWSFVSDDQKKDIANGAIAVGKAAVDAYQTVSGLQDNAEHAVAGAVTGVAKGGLQAAKKIFGW